MQCIGGATFQARYLENLRDLQALAAANLLLLQGANAMLSADFNANHRCNEQLLAGGQIDGTEAARRFASLPPTIANDASLQQLCGDKLIALLPLVTDPMGTTAFRQAQSTFLPAFQLTVPALTSIWIETLSLLKHRGDTAALDTQLELLGTSFDWRFGYDSD
jgi:hypothetical protein